MRISFYPSTAFCETHGAKLTHIGMVSDLLSASMSIWICPKGHIETLNGEDYFAGD